MAMKQFKASALPVPPSDYDQQYMTQLVRVIGNYFLQLDSKTPMQADSYQANEFIGGEFNGTDITADNVTATTATVTQLNGIAASIGTVRADYGVIQDLRTNRTISVDVMADGIYSANFYGSGRYINTPYNQFESRVTQSAAALDVAYPVALEVTDFTDNIKITGVGNTRITFTKSGIYFITYSLQFKNTTNDGHSIDVWVRYNGTDYANSNTRFHIPARKSTGDPSYVVAVTTIAGDAVNDNDYVEIMWHPSSLSVTLEYLPAVALSAGITPAIPATPSAIVQAAFISAQYPPTERVTPLSVFGFGQIGTVTVST